MIHFKESAGLVCQSAACLVNQMMPLLFVDLLDFVVIILNGELCLLLHCSFHLCRRLLNSLLSMFGLSLRHTPAETTDLS